MTNYCTQSPLQTSGPGTDLFVGRKIWPAGTTIGNITIHRISLLSGEFNLLFNSTLIISLKTNCIRHLVLLLGILFFPFKHTDQK